MYVIMHNIGTNPIEAIHYDMLICLSNSMYARPDDFRVYYSTNDDTLRRAAVTCFCNSFFGK